MNSTLLKDTEDNSNLAIQQLIEISLEDASKEVEGIELGDTIKDKELPLKDFGRVAAQSAKQIVVQRIKEGRNTVN